MPLRRAGKPSGGEVSGMEMKEKDRKVGPDSAKAVMDVHGAAYRGQGLAEPDGIPAGRGFDPEGRGLHYAAMADANTGYPPAQKQETYGYPDEESERETRRGGIQNHP
jgi:hypothetical protein